MDSSAFVIAQQSQRISALEDLLRRNESTLSLVLGRMKDSEVAMSSFNKQLLKLGGDVQLTLEDVGVAKRRLDNVDVSWRAKARETDSVIDAIRRDKPVPLNADPLFQRLAAEVQSSQRDLQEVGQALQRLNDTSNADGRALKQLETDARWLTEQLRDIVTTNRGTAAQHAKALEQLQASCNEAKTDGERSVAQLRAVIDAVVKALREELVVRLDLEGRARGSLHAEVVACFAHMKEDVVKGFSQTATNLRNLDETAHSLETVLRAEVRSRLQGYDGLVKRVEGVEDRVKRESQGAAEVLKALDNQMSAALRDVRDATSAECKNQIDRVWRALSDLDEQTVKKGAASGAINSPREEVQHRRSELQLESRLDKMKAELLDTIDKRLVPINSRLRDAATKGDLKHHADAVDVRMEEVQRQMSRTRQQSQTPATHSTNGPPSDPAVLDRVASLDDRVRSCENKVRLVAEAVQEVHDDVIDKVSRVEKQAAVMDDVQKSLQVNFERDQKRMEEHLRKIREQVVLAMETGSGSTADAGTTEPPAAGDNTDGSDPAARGPSPTSPSGSRALAASHALLEDEIESIKSSLRMLELTGNQTASQTKSDLASLHQQQESGHKKFASDITQLSVDVTQLRERQEANKAHLQEDLRQLSASCTTNFTTLDGDVQSLRIDLATRSATSGATSPGAKSGEASSVVREAVGEVEEVVAPKIVSEALRRVESEFIVPLRRELADLRGEQHPPPQGGASPRPPSARRQPPATAADARPQASTETQQTALPQAASPTPEASASPVQVAQSSNSTEPPTQSTEPPTQPTEPPTQSTEPPPQSTEPPPQSTEPPTQSTEPPTQLTEPSPQTSQAAPSFSLADSHTAATTSQPGIAAGVD